MRIPIHVTASRGVDTSLLDGYAICTDGDELGAVSRSIERRLGLQWCGGPRHDGFSVECGVKTQAIYVGTLGTPCKRSGGGWNPEGEIWFAIEVDLEARRETMMAAMTEAWGLHESAYESEL